MFILLSRRYLSSVLEDTSTDKMDALNKQKLVLHNQLVTSQLEAAADNSGLDICLGPLARPVLALDGGDLITHEALDDFLVG